MGNSDAENDDTSSKKEDEAQALTEDEATNSITAVAATTENDSNVDEEKSVSVHEEEEEEDDEESKSAQPVEDTSQSGSPKAPSTPNTETPAAKKKHRGVPPGSRRGRAPAVKGLTIPFRTVKKAMKLDPDIPIVQNEAAIMTTLAAELFLKSLAKESQSIAKSRGRNTIRYEDIAEARTNDSSMAFLKTLLP